MAEMGQLILSHTVCSSTTPVMQHQGYPYPAHINVTVSPDFTSLIDSISNRSDTNDPNDNVSLATYFSHCDNLIETHVRTHIANFVSLILYYLLIFISFIFTFYFIHYTI